MLAMMVIYTVVYRPFVIAIFPLILVIGKFRFKKTARLKTQVFQAWKFITSNALYLYIPRWNPRSRRGKSRWKKEESTNKTPRNRQKISRYKYFITITNIMIRRRCTQGRCQNRAPCRSRVTYKYCFLSLRWKRRRAITPPFRPSDCACSEFVCSRARRPSSGTASRIWNLQNKTC